ncbi:acetyl-CoA C-acyltransferase [Halalkalibacillus sediminis]|uniref:Acetyl-CoA C-acyltransferase n=1 Tax=Halalkalibacillus sediminis TaxID=2018042 RepID=A0A2I0QST5_9BACI|nr:thiolase family protein [Halalkalibacillus sediminis]PKR77403.1 acetyl-CoA C-acyltransferase [Halalkalibacillus sediminis]
MREAFIVEAVRTPVGKRKGLLSNIRAEELAAEPLKEVIRRSGIPNNMVEDVVMGCVTQVGEQAFDIARQAALIADYPVEIPGTTIDRQCGSSQQAVHFAAQAILSGDMECVVAAGVESMSRVPMFSNMQGVEFSEKLTDKYDMINQGLSAEMIAEKWNISKSELDQHALESHEKAIMAQEANKLGDHIMPLTVKLEDGSKVEMTNDEGPRKETSVEKLSQLNPVFKENGVITAGNSSQISDGAGAMLIMSSEKAKELDFTPKFKIHTRTVVGSDPTLMLTGPIEATFKAIKKANLTLDDIDIFEINEAFAAVTLAWLKDTGVDPNKLNPNGGSIAFGHPLGASGIRLMTTLLSELEQKNLKYGLQSMCEGHGMANATIIERL